MTHSQMGVGQEIRTPKFTMSDSSSEEYTVGYIEADTSNDLLRIRTVQVQDTVDALLRYVYRCEGIEKFLEVACELEMLMYASFEN